MVVVVVVLVEAVRVAPEEVDLVRVDPAAPALAPVVARHPVHLLEVQHALALAHLVHMVVDTMVEARQSLTLRDRGPLRDWLLHLFS